MQVARCAGVGHWVRRQRSSWPLLTRTAACPASASKPATAWRSAGLPVGAHGGQSRRRSACRGKRQSAVALVAAQSQSSGAWQAAERAWRGAEQAQVRVRQRLRSGMPSRRRAPRLKPFGRPGEGGVPERLVLWPGIRHWPPLQGRAAAQSSSASTCLEPICACSGCWAAGPVGHASRPGNPETPEIRRRGLPGDRLQRQPQKLSPLSRSGPSYCLARQNRPSTGIGAAWPVRQSMRCRDSAGQGEAHPASQPAAGPGTQPCRPDLLRLSLDTRVPTTPAPRTGGPCDVVVTLEPPGAPAAKPLPEDWGRQCAPAEICLQSLSFPRLCSSRAHC